jgi:putative transposase
MLYHYTFTTYKRSPFLEDPAIRDFLKKAFNDISNEKGYSIIACEVLVDHVHMLIDQDYTVSPSVAMKNIKGIASRKLFQEYPVNGEEARKLWARSFHARKITPGEKDEVIKYIREQRDSEGIDKRY